MLWFTWLMLHAANAQNQSFRAARKLHAPPFGKTEWYAGKTMSYIEKNISDII